MCVVFAYNYSEENEKKKKKHFIACPQIYYRSPPLTLTFKFFAPFLSFQVFCLDFVISFLLAKKNVSPLPLPPLNFDLLTYLTIKMADNIDN